MQFQRRRIIYVLQKPYDTVIKTINRGEIVSLSVVKMRQCLKTRERVQERATAVRCGVDGGAARRS